MVSKSDYIRIGLKIWLNWSQNLTMNINVYKIKICHKLESVLHCVLILASFDLNLFAHYYFNSKFKSFGFMGAQRIFIKTADLDLVRPHSELKFPGVMILYPICFSICPTGRRMVRWPYLYCDDILLTPPIHPTKTMLVISLFTFWFKYKKSSESAWFSSIPLIWFSSICSPSFGLLK